MEDEIRTLLHEAAPQPSAPAAFRMELNARLSAVEQIKTYRDREYRRNQRKLRIVFVTGILLGAVLVLLVLSSPFDLPNLSFFDISDISKYNGLRFVLTALGAIIAACAIILPLTLSRHHLSRFIDF